MFGLSKKTLLLIGLALVIGARYRAQVAQVPVIGSFV